MSDDSKVVHLSAVADDKLQAAAWLAKLDRGALTPDERAALARWLAQNPQNKHALRRMASVWYGLNVPLSRMPAQFARGRRLPSLRHNFSRLTVIAASVLCTVLAVSTLWLFNGPKPEATGYYATQIGEVKTVLLEDGSTITLNTNSVVEQSYTAKERLVRLIAGEAIFEVAHNKQRPFLVDTVGGVVRAIGTRFAVRVEHDRVSVTVAEGQVAVEKRTEDVTPSGPNESVAFATTSAVMVGKDEVAELVSSSDATKEHLLGGEVGERLSWAHGELVFRDQALQAVVEDIARYTTVQIIVDDSIKARRITGVLEIGNVEAMVRGISETLGLKATWVSPTHVTVTAG